MNLMASSAFLLKNVHVMHFFCETKGGSSGASEVECLMEPFVYCIP